VIPFVPVRETHRVLIHDVTGGEITGSRDGGKTWQLIGHVTKPVDGAIWLPTVLPDQVFAFFYLRGPSDVFGTAVNAMHLRFSDPAGYTLPQDLSAPLISPHAVSIVPVENGGGTPTDPTVEHSILTDIHGGTGIFGKEWSAKVGSQVLMGDGTTFAPIPYETGPDSRDPKRAWILIRVQAEADPIEYLEFENQVGGKVLMKRANEAPEQVAKVTKAVQGIGRFIGSEFVPYPGAIRANHPGVLDIGTTDIHTDPLFARGVPAGTDLNELRGGFQIVPSHHFQDASIDFGKGKGMVNLVVGPITDPPSLVRYDLGVDGRYPVFQEGMRGGIGVTYLQFKGDPRWYEMQDALKAGKFKTSNGTVLSHLRGFIPDALVEVTAFRVMSNGGL
jgi:hypothetical protein